MLIVKSGDYQLFAIAWYEECMNPINIYERFSNYYLPGNAVKIAFFMRSTLRDLLNAHVFRSICVYILAWKVTVSLTCVLWVDNKNCQDINLTALINKIYKYRKWRNIEIWGNSESSCPKQKDYLEMIMTYLCHINGQLWAGGQNFTSDLRTPNHIV